ncbi:MAG: lipid II flippase MurJ [Pseudomonadota bacterium]
MLKIILVSSIWLNVGLLLGRFSGFVREAVVASVFGASERADTVVLVLTIPDLLISILVGGALGAVLIPRFSDKPDMAKRLLYQSSVVMFFLFSIIALSLFINVEALVHLLAPGFSEAQRVGTSSIMRWVLWLLPVTVLAGAATAFLHSQNRFFVPALGTLIINSTVIVGILMTLVWKDTLLLIAGAVVFGGVLRLLSQLSLVKLKWTPVAALEPWQIDRQLCLHYIQAMASGSLLLLFPVFARAYVSFEPAGSIAIFNYTLRLIDFPLLLGVTFLATVFFPRLSSSFNESREVHDQWVSLGLRCTLVLAVVCVAVLLTLNQFYSDFVYGYGKMRVQDLDQINSLLTIGLIMIPFQGMAVFLTAVSNSRRNTRTPMLINAVGLILFIIMCQAELLGSGLTSVMLTLLVSYILVSVAFCLSVKIAGKPSLRSLLSIETIFGMLVVIILLFLSLRWLVDSQLPSILALAIGVVSGATVLAGLAYVSRSHWQNLQSVEPQDQ